MRWKGRVCFPFEHRMANRQAEWVRIGGGRVWVKVADSSV